MNKPSPQEIEAAKTAAGGWTRDTLESWGIPWPPQKGWRTYLELCHRYPDENPPPFRASKPQLDPVMQRVIAYRETAKQLLGLCESPIEEALGVAILDLFDWKQGNIQVCRRAEDGDCSLILVPQFKWSFYRTDFALLGCDVSQPLLIECDGRDFHSTPKQREHDLRKDTAALEFDFRTLRFSGKQIYADAMKCADEILGHTHRCGSGVTVE